MKFDTLPLQPAQLTVIQELGFNEMTEIQTKSIPLLLQGKDLIGQSKTGSGKTATFTLPLLNRITISKKRMQALILCPTRELCSQVVREVRKLGRWQTGLRVIELAGGQPMFAQLGALNQGPHIAVGTPGRVLDHLRRRSLDLSEVGYLVLDEADRMLDMGFQEDMEQILSAAATTRQTVFFSATFPRSIDAMSRKWMKNPSTVRIEDSEQSTPSIRQQFYEAGDEAKTPALLWLLRQTQPQSAIVFCNLKATVVYLTRALKNAGVNAAGLQGDLEQHERDRVMAKFRNLSTQVLVATDVAARGIDIKDLDVVFNYDLPAQPAQYIHRIGRTGRAGKAGLAISFGSARDAGGKLKALEAHTQTLIERKTLPTHTQLEAETQKKILNQEAPMETLRISGGRKEKLRPGDILGALTGEAGGFSVTDVGKIEIHDHFAYVAIAKSIADTAFERLRDGRIKGRKFRIDRVN